MFDDYRSAYAESMFPYICGAAFSVFLGAVGKGLEQIGASGIADVLAWTGTFLGVAMFVLGLIEFLDQREINCQRIERMRISNELMALDLKPGVPASPATPLPFAPLAFVEFIWTHLHTDGNFPTVDECAANEFPKFPRGRAQMWYEQCERAGAIVGRVGTLDHAGRPQAGRPAPGWTRERFEQAARVGGYTPEPTPLPLPVERALGMSVSQIEETPPNSGIFEE